jgi:hypothetical protein
MSKRLQVLLRDAEYREVRRAARAQNMSVSEWVRQALSRTRKEMSSDNTGKQIEAIRVAARSEYPTADIDQMLAEIESVDVTEKNPSRR